MEYKKINGSWVIVLRKGEKIIEKLTEFVEKENIRSGYLNAIGAVSSVELAHFSLDKKKYSSQVIDEPLEVVSLMGNVAVKGDEKIIHCHIAVGTNEMKLYGGHLKEATVSATCEIIFNEFQDPIMKKEDPETGLNLINFE